MNETNSHEIARGATAPRRPMYWSVRRELWENRSIYVAPLLVAAVVLFGLLLTNCLLFMSGMGATTSAQLPLVQHSLILLYGLLVLAFWHAPIYGLLLLLSAWARRAIILWAVLPRLVIAAVEAIAFNSATFAAMLKYRLIGHLEKAFVLKANGRIDSMTQLTPGEILTTPDLWIGLVFAAAFIAAAARLRRNRESI